MSNSKNETDIGKSACSSGKHHQEPGGKSRDDLASIEDDFHGLLAASRLLRLLEQSREIFDRYG